MTAHTVQVTVSGEESSVYRLYVDGQLMTEREFPLCHSITEHAVFYGSGTATIELVEVSGNVKGIISCKYNNDTVSFSSDIFTVHIQLEDNNNDNT
jgi:hypothetical protein